MGEAWAKLSQEERWEERFNSWLLPKGIEFSNPESERSYKERVTRFADAIRLREADRVPVAMALDFFPAFHSGITPEEAMYDYEKLGPAWTKWAGYFDMDAFFSPGPIGPGRVFETLDYRLYKWPGHGTDPNTTYQYVEDEYMKAGEYDLLIADPSDFWLRVYLPRIFGALEPLQQLAPLTDIIEMPITAPCLVPFGEPDVQRALEALMAAGKQALEWSQIIGHVNTGAMAAGYPLMSGGMSKAPFDTLGDTLRGTHGIYMDMFRQPDKLLEAMERLVPLEIKRGVSGATANGVPVVFMPLHKGADGFMSHEQFDTFYWPTLRQVILGLVNEGIVPMLFAEGGYNSRLEAIKDLPRGKVIWHFDQTDMARAKQVLGDTSCIMGNVPAPLLFSGTPSEVAEYCRELIETVGKGGGFILAEGAVIDEGRPENIRAVVEAAKEFGVYG
ncbi:uroporphyrinogen decarboxylase family protein [Chloroflexota bacterium]